MNWKKILRSTMCLVVVLAILLNCVPVKADAVAVTGTLAIGIAACLILMSAGVIFIPKTVDDINSIGQSFQNHMYQWGTEAQKLDEVEAWFGGLHLLDPDDDDDWSPNKTTIRLARGLLAGISLWVAGVALATKKVEDTSQTAPLGFRYLRISNDYLAGYYLAKQNNFLDYGDEILSLFQTSFYNNLAVIYCAVDTGLFGWFWDNGELKTGLWKNPDGIIHASDFGVYPLGSLELIEATGFNVPIFFSKELAESQADFLYGEYRAVYWENSTASIWSEEHELCLFEKRSVDSTWFTTVYDGVLSLSLLSSFYVWGPVSMNDVVWDQVAVIEPGMIVGDIVQDLESGELSEEEIPLQDLDYSLLFPAGQSATESLQNVVQQFYGGDMTLEKYLELTQVADTGAEAPSIVVDIPFGSELTYYQGAAPSPITVLASSPDGGTISYEWYRYGTDADGKVYPVEVLDADNSLLPSTSDLGTSHYYCRVINTDTSGLTNFLHTSSIKVSVVADPNAGTDTEPDIGTDINPDSIGQLDSDTFWEKLPSAFTQPLESLATSILDGIKEIFVPSQDYLSSKVDALTAEFGFIGPVVTAACSIVLPFNDFEPEPPVIYLHLEDTRGSYDLGGTVPFIDMTWYAEYKPIGDALLSSLLWVVFVWRLFRQLPGLIAGLPGDFVYDGLQGLHINLPSRSMDREVQKVKTRMEIAKNAKKGAGK